jgi:hypothetical protein
MSKPIAIAQGIAFAFPDVCLTPAPPGPDVPIPYPNVAQLSGAQAVATDLVVGPNETPALLVDSNVPNSTGSPPNVRGVTSGGALGQCDMTQGSGSVVYGPSSKGVVRFGDPTQQNDGNAQGTVLSAFPTVLVGD